MALAVALVTIVTGSLSYRVRESELVVLVSFAMFLHYLFSRADMFYHFAPLLPLGAILLPMVLSAEKTAQNRLSVSAGTALLLLLIMLVVVPWNLNSTVIQRRLAFLKNSLSAAQSTE